MAVLAIKEINLATLTRLHCKVALFVVHCVRGSSLLGAASFKIKKKYNRNLSTGFGPRIACSRTPGLTRARAPSTRHQLAVHKAPPPRPQSRARTCLSAGRVFFSHLVEGELRRHCPRCECVRSVYLRIFFPRFIQ